MLDPHGQVATCNSTHFFIVREGSWTSSVTFALMGLLAQCHQPLQQAGIPVYEKNFSLTRLQRRRGVCYRYLCRVNPGG